MICVQGGNALVDVLYGDWNPSGKLPYTIAKQASDYNVDIVTDSDPISMCFICASRTKGQRLSFLLSLSAFVQVPYNEGLYIDYRHFDAVCLFIYLQILNLHESSHSVL